MHREHLDAFYVLEGEVTFEVGPDARTIAVGPGGFAAVPANVIHSFVNASSAEEIVFVRGTTEAVNRVEDRVAREGAFR